MTALKTLQEATTLNEVAHILGYKPKALAYLLYVHPKATLYSKFDIPKKSGGKRTISAPCDSLKALQRSLAKLLQDCVDEIDLGKKKSTLAHGFKLGFSIFTNASPHKRRNFVLNVDIENFFGEINFGRVRGFLTKNKEFSLNPAVATILAQIACNENSLPQGAPSSPIISNLVTHILDIRLAKLAKETGCTYSRYADDLTFSINKKVFPLELAKTKSDHVFEAGDALLSKIEQAGFALNSKKTRLQYRGSRQEVTGLVVNTRVNVPSEYRRTSRAMTYTLLRDGKYYIKSSVVNSLGVIEWVSKEGTSDQLNGILGYVNQIDRQSAALVSKSSQQQNLDKKEEWYRRFLFFRDFHTNNKPVILCEGKTDNIYIKAALKRLSAYYPSLVETLPDGTTKLRIRIYNYNENNTGRIMRLTGGSDPLKQFIASYSKECGNFQAAGGNCPVLVLIDNDDGAKQIYSVVREITKSHPDGTALYYPLVRNLYLVPTPGKGSMIEHFFEKKLLGTKLDGKHFDPSDKADIKVAYGKKIFAEHVVFKDQATINFDGFKSIFDRFEAVIAHHAAVAAL